MEKLKNFKYVLVTSFPNTYKQIKIKLIKQYIGLKDDIRTRIKLCR